jgi:hypothetical protein
MCGVIASKLKAVMKISTAWKLILLAIFAVVLACAPRAIADDINPDADVPDISTADATPANPVLEIPQQCDSDSVAALCDRSVDYANFDADASANTSNDLASNPDVGSVYDYANQNITNEASAMGTMSVPLGYVRGYPMVSPGPVVVSGGPGSYQQWTGGPGAYQQWVGGPGTYRQWAPGPGYIAPMPLGYHPSGLGGGWGMRSFGGIGGGHFGRR